MAIIPVIFAKFSSERPAGVSWKSITVTNKSNSLTYTVASSVVGTSPMAVTTIVGRAEILTVSYSFELRSLLLTICMLLYCGRGQQNPLIGRRIERSFFRFFELIDIIGKNSTRQRGRIALVFQSLPEIRPQIS